MWVMHDPGWREALLPTLACCTSTLYIHRTSQTSNHQNSGTFWHFTGQTLCTLSVKKTKLKRFVARILLSCAAYYASAEALFGTGQDSRDLGLEERGTDLTLYPVVYSTQILNTLCVEYPSYILSPNHNGQWEPVPDLPVIWCAPLPHCQARSMGIELHLWWRLQVDVVQSIPATAAGSPPKKRLGSIIEHPEPVIHGEDVS
jgi:hypothetical protein